MNTPPTKRPTEWPGTDAEWTHMRAEWFATKAEEVYGYNNAEYFRLTNLADEAMAEWTRDYPEAAQAKADEADAREAAKQERLSHSHVANQRD